ncbi:MAG TPA: HEAT repeat domain-containing protein, partial [Planctomycetota bacterium]|nr:HEAT repeat domain-containing protein [Planctomycetota bacterium]
PKLWRLRDSDGDGIADQKTVVHDGFGVHTSLIGHDLHGLIVGPDRRLYFSIGDRGFHVVGDGRTLDYPHEGAVLRCELDGSRLEVVHHGLRNPQKLAFDVFGDLFTGDNNSDGGDAARFVRIVEGGDSAWRIGYQWLDDRGAWNRERLWWPQHPGQAAWHIPPLFNVADGPSGLVYDPGLGLPERYRGCFFLCDFRGGSSYSGVHALKLEHQGAGHELVRKERPIWGVLCTDVDFGPDGSLYVLDWVDGWNKTGKGRIYRVRTPQMANDLPLRALAQLLGQDFAQKPEAQLVALLQHPDRRVRQKAEFALVDQKAVAALAAAAKSPDQQLARLHAIWGLGVLGRNDAGALASVPALLDCGDSEVRAQAAKVLGDAAFAGASPALVKATRDLNARVRFQAAIALGKYGAAAAAAGTPALLELLRQNDDRDLFVRHAAVQGLGGLADHERLLAAAADHSRAVRLGVLLVLARLRDAAVARFLHDDDVALRVEAARAIYETPIEPAMPQLALLLHEPLPDAAPLLWRVVNANRVLGQPEHGQALVAFALEPERPLPARVEAVQILAEWPAPHGQDRVFGNWRPVQHPDPQPVLDAFQAAIPHLLHSDDEVIRVAAEAAGRLHLATAAEALAALVRDRQRQPAARTAALAALAALDSPLLDQLAPGIGADDPVPLRQEAVQIFARRHPETAVPVLASLLQNASTGERQAALQALGKLEVSTAVAVLGQQLDQLAAGLVAPALQLDLLEAAATQGDARLRQQLDARTAALDKDDPLAPFRDCEEGGDAGKGREIFFHNEQTRCIRCHTCEGTGGNAGPVLDGVGKRQNREYLLQSLVLPSAVIAPGFGSTLLELHNGDTLVGVVTKDQDGAVEIVDIDGKVTQVPWERIKQRSPSPNSAMPAMAGTLQKRQLRDVVAFLASLQQEAAKK